MKVAIIGGAGRMGRWSVSFFRENGHDVVLSDNDPIKLREAGQQLGVAVAENNSAAAVGADYVLLSVPIENFESVVREISPDIRPGQAVIDITSTKVKPVEIMHRYIGSGTVLGAHPLFGPGAGNIVNKNFVLTPTGEREISLAEKIKQYLEERGARVSLMSPAEHDEMMALVLGLSHFIALVAADTLLDSGKLHPMEAAGSSTYKVLLTLVESVLSEDPELYASIQMNLPDVIRFENSFLEKTAAWKGLVENGDRTEFARRMQALKVKLEKVAPDFQKAYEKMYRIVEGL